MPCLLLDFFYLFSIYVRIAHLMAIKAVFLDRDGTINEDTDYVHKPEDFHLLAGVLEALKLLTEKGVKTYIITNQAGIARGYYTEDDFKNLTEYMTELFLKEGIRIDGVFYCPHHPEGKLEEYRAKCSCRKPATGMLDKVIAKNRFLPNEMVLIGDKNTDIETGRKLNMKKTYLVETGYGLKEKADTKADMVVPNLLAAVNDILENL